jgi:DNA mismatch endonuclease (patch repair protein)
MRRVRQRDTCPEVALRFLIHRLGLRYAIDGRPVASVGRRADLVFRSARVAVFVDGCFWHGCPDHATWPKNNAQWWRAKIRSNRSRDRDTDELLKRNGWLSIRVWEHEEPGTAALRIARLVRRRRRAMSAIRVSGSELRIAMPVGTRTGRS